MSESFEEFAREAVGRSLAKMEQSNVFLAILDGHYEEHALTVLQFGLAVLRDMPIYLLVPKGQKVPERIRRLADGIEEYLPDDLEAATKRLLTRAGEHLKPR